MKKQILMIVVLVFAKFGIWAQIAGNPVTTAASVSVCPGATTVDIPITVNEFPDVAAVSLKLGYDHTKISSPTVIYRNPAFATYWGGVPPEYSGGLEINTADFTDEIRVSGFGEGITLSSPNLTLFTLRFTIVGSTTSAALTFNENTQGTWCEYAIDDPPAYTPFIDTPTVDYYIPGGVTVLGAVTYGSITSADETICSNTQPSSMEVTGADGSASFAYQWYSMSGVNGPCPTGSVTTGWTSLGTTDGANTATYTPTSGLTASTTYACFVTPGGSPTCGTATWAGNCRQVTINALQKISGTIYYNRCAGDVTMSGTDFILKLYKNSDVLHTTQIGSTITTITSGYYEFTNLCPDFDYDIVATRTQSTEGSVNTTDAAQVNYWGTHQVEIQKVRFFAGDVTGSTYFINGTDAGRIQQHFVNGTAFNRADWIFWVKDDFISNNSQPPPYPAFPKVTLAAGSDKTADMYGLCTGDFNLSFDPNSSKTAVSTTLDLVTTGTRQVGANQEFDLPLRLMNASDVGAISLILNFPAELVEVKDVLMNGASGQLDWAVRGNELRIGWNSPEPLNLASGAALVTLHLKTTGAFSAGNTIMITQAADPLNELADGMYNIINDPLLGVDAVDASTTGIRGQVVDNKLELANNPNPFNTMTTIAYTLPSGGYVTLEIRNLFGVTMKILINKEETAGDHFLDFNAAGLPAGIYTATIRLATAYDQLIRTIKLVTSK